MGQSNCRTTGNEGITGEGETPVSPRIIVGPRNRQRSAHGSGAARRGGGGNNAAGARAEGAAVVQT